MYYFLDIDGVLNKKADWVKAYTINNECLGNFKTLLSYDKNPRIILSSTWRSNLDIIGEYIKIDDVTPSSNKTRQDEIEYYIKRHNIGKNYIIIDDDESLFPNKDRINLYITNHLTGLTNEDVRKIRKVIKRYK